MKSSLRKLRGFALQRHEQRMDRRGGHSPAAAAAANELLAASQVRGHLLRTSRSPCGRVGERACE